MPSGASVVIASNATPSMAPWTTAVWREKAFWTSVTRSGDTNWLAMLPTIVKTTNHVTIGADPHAVNNLPIIVNARLMLVALKKTHPRHTRWKVAMRARSTRPLLIGTASTPRATLLLRRHLPITCPNPWYAPQAMKVQPAPCQRPPRIIVIMMLRAILLSEPLFPPRGMYR